MRASIRVEIEVDSDDPDATLRQLVSMVRASLEAQPDIEVLHSAAVKRKR